MQTTPRQQRSGVVPKIPWLRRLRWTAVTGQAATVLGVEHGLGVALPERVVLGVIALGALTNVGLYFVPAERAERPGFLAGVLGLDVVLLTLLLEWTGGPYNPFSTLYLVLVALAAVALTPRLTWGVTALACAGFAWLFLTPGWPVRPGDPICGVGPNLPLSIHLAGMLIAFVLAAVLVTWFAARLQEVLLQHERELGEARAQALVHERFAALATLAAGAAHELGTPLGTIVVAAGELAREAKSLPEFPELLEDAELIRREAFRCRAILDRLQSQAEDRPKEIALGRLLEELGARYPGVQVEAPLELRSTTVFAPPDALMQAAMNLIGNALDASPSGRGVRVALKREGDWVEIRVRDEGAGIPEEVAAHAGEPFFTTKSAGRGMGLGLFLVRLLARRVSGEFRFECPAEGGTCAVLSLPTAGRGEGLSA